MLLIYWVVRLHKPVTDEGTKDLSCSRQKAYARPTLMSSAKRILVVAHDPAVKATRAAILEHEGYEVAAVETSEEALARLEAERFDLVLVGRSANAEAKAAGALVRERHPALPILKVVRLTEFAEGETFATRSVEPMPAIVVEAVKELIGQ
jgi:hypothetical protein